MLARASLALTVTALAVAAAAPVSAGPPNDAVHIGECYLVSATDRGQFLTNDDTYEAVLAGYAASYSPTIGHNIVHVTVRCHVVVEGDIRASIDPGSGDGAAYTFGRAVYQALDYEDVNVCTEITTVDAHGQTRTTMPCTDITKSQVWPQEVTDVVCEFEPITCSVMNANGFLVHNNLFR